MKNPNPYEAASSQAFDERTEADETILPARRSHPETIQCSHPLKIK